MTTTQIATFADPEGLASPDLNLQVELRRNVTPDFYEQIGEVGWRRRYGSETVTAGNRDFTTPIDFGDLKKIIPGTSGDQTYNETHALTYIGDNPDLVLAAEAATARSAPSGYYIDWTLSPYPAIKLSCPVDQDYTFRFVYISRLNFANDTATIELDSFIPKNHQWALVVGLKRALYEKRFGVGDSRYMAADAEYARLIKQAKKNPEKTGYERPRFVD